MERIAKKAEFLLPKKNIDLNKWAIIACDQHTANPNYWSSLQEYVNGNHSALDLIYPEVYLSDNRKQRIESISKKMNEYISEGIFDSYSGMVLLKRTLTSGKTRKGLLLEIDLENYGFLKSDKKAIRASEGTVIERIPPRLEIREKCSLELPHILVLIDDKSRSVIEPLFENESNFSKLYDFDLNMDGGHIEGRLIESCDEITLKLEKLLNESVSKYDSPLLFAVGDGNHSLATAKASYENEKAKNIEKNQELLSRYALVEVVNIYDDGIEFEPIHRIILGVDNNNFIKSFIESQKDCKTEQAEYTIFNKAEKFSIRLPKNPVMAVKAFEDFYIEYIKTNNAQVDYIHGDEELKKLCIEKNAVGLELKAIDKKSLFPYVANYGSLPKKTFSMGEAADKRYYLEARKIK